jgi:hypothetical protein
MNNKRHFRSFRKSQLNINRFRCPEKKKQLIVLIEHLKIFLDFIKVWIEYHKNILWKKVF